jgi:superfamily I DNA/RNA helicase
MTEYSGLYVVVGPPGTGKTTFLAAQVKRIVEAFKSTSWMDEARSHPNPVLICSLTRAAAAEVAGRDLPIGRAFVGTLHAHCYRVLNRPTLLRRSDVNEWNSISSYRINPDSFSDGDAEESEAPEERESGQGLGDVLMGRADLLRHRLIDPSDWPPDVAGFHEDWSQFKLDREVVDFTDLIVNAAQIGGHAPGRPSIIMCDEAQDMSALELSVIKEWGRWAQATIIVGDPWQALYTWRGADPQIFFDETIPADHRRVLSQSYRVPDRVLRVSVGWVRDHLLDFKPIEYRPRAADKGENTADALGETICIDATLRNCDSVVDRCEAAVNGGHTCMVQATCGFMLSSILGNLRRKGIPFANPWRKYRRDWNPLSRSGGVTIAARASCFLSACGGLPVARVWTVGDMAAWSQHIEAKGTLIRGAKAEIQHAASKEDGADRPVELGDIEAWFEPDAVEALVSFWNGDDVDAGDALAWWSSHLLAAQRKASEYLVEVVRCFGAKWLYEEPPVYVGTIHSFKGAEADESIVFPDLSSAGFRQWCRGESEERDEIVRVFYVAMTRARKRLVVCRPSSRECCPLRSFVDSFSE